MIFRCNLLIQLIFAGIFGCARTPTAGEATSYREYEEATFCNKPEGCISEAEKQKRATQIDRETEYPETVVLTVDEAFHMEYSDLRFPRVMQEFAPWSAVDLGLEPDDMLSLRLVVGSVRADGCTLIQDSVVLQVGYRAPDWDGRPDDQRFDLIAGVGSSPMSLSYASEYVPWLYIESDRPCSSIQVDLVVTTQKGML